ncbi:MAG TPA: O-antigen ligase family protein [Solirubrobacteraceae bacterium]|nr:O-antigen ligase family protein [Solirubrobacteraceae bacterium]
MRPAAPPRASRWRRLAPIGALCTLAAIAAVAIGYSPTIAPPGLHARSVQLGAARSQLLIDNTDSALADIGTQTQYQTELGSQLALSYALYLRGDAATAEIGREIGLGSRSISASGPFTLLLERTNYARKLPTLPEPRNVDGSYRLLTDVDGAHPVLSLYAQAPTVHEAVAIVETARGLLERHLDGDQTDHPLPGNSDVVVRPLGPTTAGLVGSGARWQLMAFGFFAVMLVGGSLLWARRRRTARAHDAKSSIAKLDRLDDPLPGADEWPHTRRALPWALAAFIAMLFLVPFDAIALPLHLPVNGTLDRPVLIALGMLWFATLAVVSGAARPRMRLGRIHYAALAFFAVCLLSVALNGQALANMTEVGLTVKKLALLASYIVFFFIAASVLRPREVARFAALMVGLGVIVALGTIIEYRFHYNLFYELWGTVLPVTKPNGFDTIDSIGRLTIYGPTLQPLELAAMLAMVLPFAILGAIDAKTRRQRILYIVAVGLLLAGGVATARKTSLVVPAVVIVLLACYRPRDVFRTVGRLCIVLFAIVHFTSPGALGSVINQLEPGHVNSALTTTDRTARYDAVTPDLLRHPLIGRGYESYDPQKYRILDNQYLDLLITVGAIGTLLYLTIFAAMISAARPLIRDRSGHDPRRASLALAATVTVIAVAIGSALFDVLSFPHVPYLLFFVAAMIVALREASPAAEPARLRVAPPVVSAGPNVAPGEPGPQPPGPVPTPPETREPVLV